MFQLSKFFLIFSTIFFVSCSSIVHKPTLTLSKSKTYVISSFWNYTQTPMAGLKAASIVESVLSKESIRLHSLIEGSEKSSLTKNKIDFLKEQINLAKQLKANYLITGEVQEWRYKAGIDAQPVVSYSIKVIDLSNSRTIYNGVVAKSGWGDKSIGVVAQEIAQEIIPNFTD